MQCSCIVFFFIKFLFSAKPAAADIVFDEKGWKTAADYLKEGYNPKIKPCENFFEYACGNWMKNRSKPEEQWEILVRINKLDEQIQESIEAINVDDKATPNYKKSIKVMYDMCRSSTDEDVKKSVKDLFNGMVKIAGTPPILSKNKKAKEDLLKENVWHLLGKVRRELPMSRVFFEVDVQKTEVQCRGLQASLLLTPITFIDENEKAENVLNDFHALTSILNVTIDEKETNTEAENLVKFQQALKDLINSTSEIGRTENKNLQNMSESQRRKYGTSILTLEDLNQFNPNISWEQYFKGLFNKEQFAEWNQTQPSISVMDLYFFEYIDDVLEKFDTETVFNYIFWRSMKSVFSNFNTTNKKEDTTKKQTATQCAKDVSYVFKAATARIYFDHFKIDPFELKHDVTIVAKTIFSAFKFLVASANWLDAAEKLAVIDKVEQIKFYAGIPDWISNDTEIDRRTIPVRPHVSAAENMITLMKENFDRELDYIIGLRDLNLEEEPSLEVGGFYVSMFIDFKVGTLVPPFYSPRYPLAAKYGYIGYLIGHELIHGFDAVSSRQMPPNAKTWLKEGTMKVLDKKVDCVEKQYSSFCFEELKKCVNGRTTIRENVADVDGLKIAYMAYKIARETMEEEPPLPGFVELTGDQLFFLFFARCRCTTGGEVEELLRSNDFGEPHPPNVVRMTIPFRNFPTFAKSFKCDDGSTYAPLHTCNIWGSYKGIKP